LSGLSGFPCSASVTKRLTGVAPTPKVRAAYALDIPCPTAATIFSLRSSEYAFMTE
jgi:hypothetical protein